jgi:hypothetical protein
MPDFVCILLTSPRHMLQGEESICIFLEINHHMLKLKKTASLEFQAYGDLASI